MVDTCSEPRRGQLGIFLNGSGVLLGTNELALARPRRDRKRIHEALLTFGRNPALDRLLKKIM
jgi:hypothetical protein